MLNFKKRIFNKISTFKYIIMNKVAFITDESNKMKQEKLKKIITIGEQIEEK